MELSEQFVPHNIAVLMRNLGFDEPCFGYWSHWIEKATLIINPKKSDPYKDVTNHKFSTMYHFKQSDKRNNCCLAPTWFQLHVWIDKKQAPDFGKIALEYPIGYKELLLNELNNIL